MSLLLWVVAPTVWFWWSESRGPDPFRYDSWRVE